MGKSLDDLNLDPLSHRRPERQDDSLDPRQEEWYQFTTEILEMICSDEYRWAEDTLTGIRQTVEERKFVTLGQRKAVENIKHARQRSDGWRRRYEGYRR